MSNVSNELLWNATTAEFDRLGLDPALYGYEILRTVIMMIVKDPKYADHSLQRIYTYIADDGDDDPRKYSNLCKFAIDKAYASGDSSKWTELFGDRYSAPSVSAFVKRLEHSVKLSLR